VGRAQRHGPQQRGEGPRRFPEGQLSGGGAVRGLHDLAHGF
jgi:hypothetical protein